MSTSVENMRRKLGVKKNYKPGDLISAANKAKTYKGKSTKVGGGGRFEKMTDKLKASGKSEKSAKAIAASIGRKKYGAKKMAKMAAKGRKK